jgi:hypothetical protein
MSKEVEKFFIRIKTGEILHYSREKRILVSLCVCRLSLYQRRSHFTDFSEMLLWGLK